MMFSIGLTACGQKGALYLPDRPAPPATSTNSEFDAQPANNADPARKP
ncbi:Prokaryotic lipoprotein-attachment site [Oxalobacteraceae bacterium]|jgi:predicted small lipoprotein YifL|nr:lipoprotein [Oxalobacteraceae bacterium]